MTPSSDPTDGSKAHFEREIREQPEVLARLLQDEHVRVVAAALRSRAPHLIATLARGSSDNAVTFFGYLAAQTLGLPVASLPPSLLSVFNTPMKVAGGVCIAVSQSGESSDVVEGLAALKRAGALTVALSNDAESALAGVADYTLLQGAGRERAVAASKTFSSQMLLLALLVAHWSEDAALLAALEAVPARIDELLGGPQGALQDLALRLTGAHSLYVLGRGLSYAPALETALKLKETCYLHAEAYSSAEFQHGPLAAVSPDDPVLLLALTDRTERSSRDAARKLREANAALSVIGSSAALRAEAEAAVTLPAGLHPVTEAFLMIAFGQLLALYLAAAKGLDPDVPRHLNKVTKTM